MSTTNYPGIDYSGFTQCNRNSATGIRYGVIPANDVGSSWYDSAEPDYGEPTCPKCGNPAVNRNTRTEQCNTGVAVILEDESRESYSDYDHDFADYACDHCRILFGGQSAFPDEPIGGQNYEGGGYKLHEDSSGDLWVLASPYFTYAQFCSPCAPGACYLRNPLETPEESNRAYCLGSDWFEDGKAPYPVYSVETGELVTA